eukprot:1158443-Pelagomonas_calceolata.AAC.15
MHFSPKRLLHLEQLLEAAPSFAFILAYKDLSKRSGTLIYRFPGHTPAGTATGSSTFHAPPEILCASLPAALELPPGSVRGTGLGTIEFNSVQRLGEMRMCYLPLGRAVCAIASVIFSPDHDHL